MITRLWCCTITRLWCWNTIKYWISRYIKQNSLPPCPVASILAVSQYTASNCPAIILSATRFHGPAANAGACYCRRRVFNQRSPHKPLTSSILRSRQYPHSEQPRGRQQHGFALQQSKNGHYGLFFMLFQRSLSNNTILYHLVSKMTGCFTCGYFLIRFGLWKEITITAKWNANPVSCPGC